MNRPTAEKLLGGYATGILTDSEKQVLFAAALEHQELFDALMDEEALRELLADPEVRKRLLAVLQPLAEPKLRKFWRRPAFIGLAASLFALVTTSLLVLRSPQYRSLPAGPSEASTPSRIPAAVAQDQAEPAPSRPPSQKPASPPKAKSVGHPERSIKAESGAIAAAPMAMETNNRASERAESKQAEVVEASPQPARALEASPRAEIAGAMVAEDKVAKQVKGSMQAGAGLSEEGLSPFESTLEHLPGGQVRLQVIWGPHGYLYVLKRTPTGSTLLTAKTVTSGQSGRRTARFEMALNEKDALDVYVLIESVADPGSLPATGTIQGERRRVYPE